MIGNIVNSPLFNRGKSKRNKLYELKILDKLRVSKNEGVVDVYLAVFTKDQDEYMSKEIIEIYGDDITNIVSFCHDEMMELDKDIVVEIGRE